MDHSDFEKRIAAIEERNRKVEGDKAWEGSLARIGVISLITYIVALLFMIVLGAANIFLNALIPVAGFVLSTLSLPFIKRWWISKKHI